MRYIVAERKIYRNGAHVASNFYVADVREGRVFTGSCWGRAAEAEAAAQHANGFAKR